MGSDTDWRYTLADTACPKYIYTTSGNSCRSYTFAYSSYARNIYTYIDQCYPSSSDAHPPCTKYIYAQTGSRRRGNC